MGLNTYVRIPRWQLGSIFLKKSSQDIFKLLADTILEIGSQSMNDEDVMMRFTDNNVNGINNRIKTMNGTYDFGLRKIPFCYEKANKPIKILHFHPRSATYPTLAKAMYGKNGLGIPLMNQSLIKLFNRYGYN